jgi:hypothetical protein
MPYTLQQKSISFFVILAVKIYPPKIYFIFVNHPRCTRSSVTATTPAYQPATTPAYQPATTPATTPAYQPATTPAYQPATTPAIKIDCNFYIFYETNTIN